jgi:REP element-mobilizing transposase RayT
MKSNITDYKRKSFIQHDKIYFWTATINKWQHLLATDEYKSIIISSLNYLSDAGKVDIFVFVIMPNHLHLIWRIKNQNGKETAQGSFLKYTAHEFKKLIINGNGSINLPDYAVEADNKSYEFWQRDSLAVHLYSRDVAYQKMDYIHLNPLAARWQLAKEPYDYQYSSAKFYEKGVKEFSFLKDLREEF